MADSFTGQKIQLSMKVLKEKTPKNKENPEKSKQHKI